MKVKSEDIGATISVWWEEVGLVSVTLSPEDWRDIKTGEEVEIIGNGCILDGKEIQDRWLFQGGEDGFLDVTYADDEYDYIVGVGTELRDVEIIEHPTPHRKSKESNGFISHEEMATLIKKKNYSTCQGCIGENDTRPFVLGRFVIPVAYVQYNVIDVHTTQQVVWPEGDILGYLRNAGIGDMLIFPGWRGNQRWQSDDIVYDLKENGWVTHYPQY